MSHTLKDETVERVVSVLREKYKIKGADFVFKAKRVNVSNFSNQTIGQILAEAVKRNYPVAYYKRPKVGSATYQTKFSEHEK